MQRVRLIAGTLLNMILPYLGTYVFTGDYLLRAVTLVLVVYGFTVAYELKYLENMAVLIPVVLLLLIVGLTMFWRSTKFLLKSKNAIKFNILRFTLMLPIMILAIALNID